MEGPHPVRHLPSVLVAQVPRHHILSDHYVFQRQITQWGEVERLPLRLFGGHLDAEIGIHEVSLGLISDNQVSGCHLGG